MNLCKYKDIAGKPREGSHKLRDPIFDTAVIDVVFTLFAGCLISKYFNYSLIIILFILFIISIIAHRAFCVRTKVDKFLFS